jgi:hypothetical protein
MLTNIRVLLLAPAGAGVEEQEDEEGERQATVGTWEDEQARLTSCLIRYASGRCCESRLESRKAGRKKEMEKRGEARTSQAGLQQVGQLGVAEGHVPLLVTKSCNHVAQRCQ